MFIIKSQKKEKRIRVREFFFVMCASVGKSCNDRERQCGEEEGRSRDQPAKQESFSLFRLTVVDVGWAEALLRLFGGEV